MSLKQKKTSTRSPIWREIHIRYIELGYVFRSRHRVATEHETDNKVHDRHAMQHFTDHKLKYLETYTRENFPEDMPKGHIVCLHHHSKMPAHTSRTWGL